MDKNRQIHIYLKKCRQIIDRYIDRKSIYIIQSLCINKFVDLLRVRWRDRNRGVFKGGGVAAPPDYPKKIHKKAKKGGKEERKKKGKISKHVMSFLQIFL